jgi:hypothetical protein
MARGRTLFRQGVAPKRMEIEPALGSCQLPGSASDLAVGDFCEARVGLLAVMKPDHFLIEEFCNSDLGQVFKVRCVSVWVKGA